MLKRLFYSSAIILMLAIAYHLGARNAQAQAGSTISGMAMTTNTVVVMTPNGDCYLETLNSNGNLAPPPYYMGNFWGGTISVQPETWTGVKEKYRK